MGIHGRASNIKKPIQQYKRNRVHRQRRADKKKQRGEATGEIADIDIITTHHLKKRRTSPRSNITLSGKKKHKLLKQLKHMQADKSKMEVVDEVIVTKRSKKVKVRDVEMKTEKEASPNEPAENSTADEEMQE